MAGPIKFSILANASQANRTLNQTASTAQRVGSGFRKMAVPALAALGAIGLAGKEAMDSVVRIERINAQTTAAIKSTGGAARVSAKHVENLAGRIEGLTASEAETVQEGANVLLTFTNIRNGVGKTNKIFDQSVAIANDMSRALGTDMKSASTLVGKALNDPVKGLSALSRVGVSFTAQQKKQITSLVESGKTMKAQKVIMGELNKEFGGSGEAFAKTTAGQIELAKHEFGTLTEGLVVGLLPTLKTLATSGTNALKWAGEHSGTVRALALGIAGLAGFILAVNVAMTVSTAVTASWTAVTTVAATAQKAMAAAAIGTRIGLAALAIQTAVTSAATKAAAAAQWVWNAAMTANPIGLIIAGVALLVGGFILLYKKSDTFRAIVQTAMRVVTIQIRILLQIIRTVATWVGQRLGKAWKIFKVAATVQIRVLVAVVNAARGRITAVWNRVKTAAIVAWTLIRGRVSAVVSAIVSRVASARERVSNAWTAIKDRARTAWDTIREKVVTVTDRIKTVVNDAKTAVTNAWDGMKSGIQWLIDKIQALIDKIKSIPKPSIPNLGDLNPFRTGGLGHINPFGRGGPGTGGQRTYNINVSVPVGGSPIETGRQIVKAIEAFEMAGGAV